MIERIDEPTGEEAAIAMEITRRRLEFEKTLEPMVKRMTELQMLRVPKYKVRCAKLTSKVDTGDHACITCSADPYNEPCPFNFERARKG